MQIFGPKMHFFVTIITGHQKCNIFMLALLQGGPRGGRPATALHFFTLRIQSGRSSPAKHRDAYFLAVYGFMKDPVAPPGLYENQEC